MILFLDFDGVCHPDQSRDKFCRMHLLEDWLRAEHRSQVSVVISSSWREVHKFKEIVSFFAEDLQDRVVGCAPLFHRIRPEPEPSWLSFKREFEAIHWVSMSGDPQQKFVSLDDMPNLFRPECERLVLCDPKVGLTPEKLEEVDTRLGLAKPTVRRSLGGTRP